MKKKVLFFMTSFDRGGTEKVTIDLANNLDSNKYSITIMTIFDHGGFKNLINDDITVKSCFSKFIRGIARIFYILPSKWIYKLFIKEKYDIEIAVGDGITSRFIGGSTNKLSKKISWIHMDVLKRGSKMYEFRSKKGIRKFYEPFDSIICVSQDCKKSFVNKFGFEHKIAVKSNILDENKILSKAQESQDIEFNKEVLNLVSVGRIVEQKGYDRLVKVHNRLIKEGYKHNIYIVGDGHLKNEIEKYIEDNNLLNTFHILGFQENPYKYIKNADWFISASRDEAFSTVLSEAVLLEKPILTTNCAGTTELLGKSEFGIIVENSTDGIYCGLKNILTNNELMSYYSKKVTERKKLLEMQRCINEWEKIL